MTESDFQALLQRYLDGHCSPREQALVERWYNRLDEADGPVLHGAPQAAIEDAIWQRLAPRRRSPAAGAKVVRYPATFWQSPRLRWAAALLVLALGTGYWGPTAWHVENRPVAADGWTQHTNATAQPQLLQLPDGSRVTLHPGSSLRYTAAFAGPKREVYLTGEAFFNVTKNPSRPFLVLTNQVVTTVLGTSFRVIAYAGAPKASVAVREGRVAVQARAGANLNATPAHPAAGVLLLPNQQVVYSVAARQLKKELVDKPVLLAPQVFEFEERPVTEVLTALEKAYGVEIFYDRAKLAGCTVSITFYDEPLFEKLGLLCKSLGAYYSLSDAQIIFHSKGCQTAPTE